jgi:chaperonin GroES
MLLAFADRASVPPRRKVADGLDRAQPPVTLPALWHSPVLSASTQNTTPARRITMKIRPLQDRVIVKRVQEEEKTKGGIIIPDTAKEKPIEGQVVAVGNGKILEDGKVRPLDIKPGDRVLFSKYAGTEIKIDGEEHLMMREEDILGVIEK